MPTPTDSQRLLRILIGRHRKIAQLYYNDILDNINKKQSAVQQTLIYRGLTNDIVGLIKELREQEAHIRNITYDEFLEQVESMPGTTFKDKFENLMQNGK